MDASESLWRQYDVSVDLYKHYLKLAIELNVFYYAITGAIVSYYLAHESLPLMRRALLLPFGMSLMFSGLLFYGAYLNLESRREMFRIQQALGLKVVPEFIVLTAFLSVLALLMVGVAIGLAILMWCTNAT